MIVESKTKKKRPLRYGMVGGGPGSFIGAVHRAAIRINGEGVLVAGCFSDIPEEIEQAGEELRIPENRNYNTYMEMAEKEAVRDHGIDFVSIVTPNRLHYPVAKTFLEKGMNVVCEKPMTITLDEAFDLKRLAQENGCLFCVGYTYTGYVMAKQARDIIMSGEIGEVLIVVAEYMQDWLRDTIEKEGQRQASWRMDPAQAGASNCVADIGTHIENMVNFMTGLRIKKLCASMDIVGEDRKLDTNSSILLKYDNGASGNYLASQVAVGCGNALKVRIFGTKGAVEFEQEKCNYLKVMKKGQPSQVYSCGREYISPDAASFSRLPVGHPEGFFEAYGNIYRSFMAAVYAKLAGEKADETEYDYPTVDAGIDGVRFVEKCVESSKMGSVWVNVE